MNSGRKESVKGFECFLKAQQRMVGANKFPPTRTGLEMDCQRIVLEMLAIAQSAGEEIMKHFRAAGIPTISKADGSPVTLADTAADDIILSGLVAAFPNVPTISEERPDSQIAMSEQCFIVDPLDGTQGFASGYKEFTVNIAYVEHGVPKYGVILAPALGRLFYNSWDGSLVEMRRSSGDYDYEAVAESDLRCRHSSRPVNVLASWSARKNSLLDQFLVPYEVANVSYMSSSLKFCLIANGEADLYPRFGRTMEWDTAAGHALVRAVGGDVAKLDDSKPLIYGKHGCENPFFVAFAPGIELLR